MFQPPDNLCGLPSDLLQQPYFLLVPGPPDLGAVLQIEPHKVRLVGENHFLATPLLIKLRIPLALQAACTQWWFVSSSSSTRTSKSFVTGLLSVSSSPSLYVCLGLPQPYCSTLRLALLNLIRFTQFHFVHLSRSFWMATLPSLLSIF